MSARSDGTRGREVEYGSSSSPREKHPRRDRTVKLGAKIVAVGAQTRGERAVAGEQHRADEHPGEEGYDGDAAEQHEQVAI